MKGKSIFTKAEINRLFELIKQRRNASGNKQKGSSIRNKMRKEIGFYGQDDWGIRDCKESDLQRLIDNKQIIVIDD